MERNTATALLLLDFWERPPQHDPPQQQRAKSRLAAGELTEARAFAEMALGACWRELSVAEHTADLQADPEELPHARRQVEGGHVVGHVEQLQTEERHYVANDHHG